MKRVQGQWGVPGVNVHTTVCLCHDCSFKLPQQDFQAVVPVTPLAPNPPFTQRDDGLPSAIHKLVTSLLVRSNELYT